MADLAGWPYWKVVSITGQAGAGTDYQAKLTIGDSAGGDFHLEGHCTNFPHDIRITDDDGTTLLDHFVEDLTADPIVVHVEVKDDLGSNRDIRIYYGKSGETTASNGANTFIQYHGSATAQYLKALDLTHTIIAEWRIKWVNVAALQMSLANLITNTDDYVNIYYNSTAGLGSLGAAANEGTSSTTGWDTNIIAENTYHRLRIEFQSTTCEYFVNDVSLGTVSNNLPNENLGMCVRNVNACSFEQDWAFVRKYNSPEPAFSSAGAEQTPTGVSPTGVFYGPLVGPFGGPI